ncbi:Peptidase M14, carboxypeptidase A precursor [Winogradskyella psychrotolerans RS-3]|uniref:Peptidase M14, carboxypeptidase A n=1 Tax=Winogradskyella psychrotolerans RS-3 TaxID=641526 RepID=S7VP88_9FLAO|nr:M14 metallopeptidase family protein [Winogradskyella psychrotolerans]EPR72065.1 Peptidase M14, carboxypeptidase A precursor [Winogradskyella psychrotolerans RS-3]
MQKLVTSLLVLFCFQLSLIAQTISSPSDFLGYEIGTQFSRNHQVIDYFKTVEKQVPNQVKLKTYGKTNERRGLYLAYISSEENIENLETIRENNLKNIGLLNGESSADDIAIVWLSYNVHGNEASSSEAAMLTLFKLLTEKQEWLKNTVVIIDPSVNPDGRDRYINWYNETASQPYDIDRQASEHNEPWPGGRPNHYLFDLNRDWVWASQVETQQRLEVYNKWMPHVHVDFHEQGINEPYYFAPAAEPFHEVITDWQRDFQTEIGKNHAKYFDAEGWLFFTRERFDLFYPSYGDTYPTFMGAMGMTYEQGGHGMAGLGIFNDEGHVLTLVERLTHHTTSGLSTVEMASKNAKQLNTEFAKFFDNSNLKYKSYVLKGNEDKLNSLKTLLNKHHITFENATASKVSGMNYATGKQGSLNIDSKALVVHANQPKGKMVKALFEPNAKLSDSLTYDITAWSLPYAYGLEAMASTTKIPSETLLSKKELQTLTDTYGYVSKWNSMDDAQFLAALLKHNFKVRFTEKPFTSNNNKFERGSLIITKGDNKHIKNFLETLNTIVQEQAQHLTQINSGFSQTTPDIGSPDIKLVNNQKVAVLSGEGTSSLSYGEVWHFFEQQLHYPLTSINTDDFGSINLDKYHVLILPNGNYRKVFTDDNMTKLKVWVRTGGKVIAIDGALRSFAGKDGFSLNYKKQEDDVEKKDNLTAYADREREYSNNLITGAIFNAKVDNTHPMAFGYDDNYFTLKLGSTAYSLLDSGYNVAYLNNTKVYSGFAGQNALKSLDQTLVFGEEHMGNGSFIYMVDNTLFRSFWENGKLFLVNSIFFVNNNAYEL